MSSAPVADRQEVTVYGVGLCYLSVCTSLSPEDVTKRVNAEMPSGTSGGWRISKGHFANGSPNPCPCDTNPDTHKHYLMEC